MSDELVYTPIFKSVYEFAKVLPMEEGYTLLMACCAYANGEDVPELSDLVRVIFENDAKPAIDRTLAKARRNRENGKRNAKANPSETEGEPNANPNRTQTEPKPNPERTQSEPNANPTETQSEPNANPKGDMINDQGSMINDQLKVKVCEFADEFAPPTVEEVGAYGEQFCRDRGIPPGGFSADRFWHYNESRGWRVNGKPMQRWRSAVANWILKDHPEAKGRGQRGQPDRFAAYE